MNIDFNPLFLQKKGIFMVNKKNPFAFKVKQIGRASCRERV